MANYEYIIASLPDITTGWKFGEKGPDSASTDPGSDGYIHLPNRYYGTDRQPT